MPGDCPAKGQEWKHHIKSNSNRVGTGTDSDFNKKIKPIDVITIKRNTRSSKPHVEPTPTVKTASIVIKITDTTFSLNKYIMKKNEHSKVTLSPQAVQALQQLFNVLTAENYC